jgi:folate-dependent phosphoribosylglycinamide formyltransferase PurN
VTPSLGNRLRAALADLSAQIEPLERREGESRQRGSGEDRSGEEALRILMTVLFPRLAAGKAKPDDGARAARLLCGIEAEAARDVRYLDAFSNYVEVCKGSPSLGTVEGWGEAMRIFRRAIERFNAGGSFEDGWVQLGAPFPDAAASWPKGPELAEPPGRVLILADNPHVGWRILREVGPISALDVHVLICRQQSQSMLRFPLRQAAGMLMSTKTGARGLATSLLRGRWQVTTRVLDDPKVVDWIKQQHFDVGLHGMGVIYRRPVLDAFRLGVLNSHIGLLPPFRGRSVVEWSLLAGAPLGATVFFIDARIDTGERMVVWRPAPIALPATVEQLRQGLFDSDGANYAAALAAMRQPSFAFARNEVAQGRRFYVMSSLLRELAQFALKQRRSTRQQDAKSQCVAGSVLEPAEGS